MCVGSSKIYKYAENISVNTQTIDNVYHSSRKCFVFAVVRSQFEQKREQNMYMFGNKLSVHMFLLSSEIIQNFKIYL